MKSITHTEQCSGTRVQYALSKESGQVINIENVRRGKDCDCRCLGCGEDLVANKGDVRVHYFSHLPDGSGISNRPCKTPKKIFETLSHEMGKKWIERIREITVPSYFHHKKKDPDGCEYSSIMILPAKKLTFSKVEIEEWQGNYRYRPDCIGYIGEQPIIIEIYVSHKVDEKKLKKLKADGVSAIEIVLKHGVLDDSWESIDKAMRTARTIRWLNCPEGDTAEALEYSKQQFLQQRKAFEEKQANLKQRRRQSARANEVERQAEDAYEEAKQEIPEIAKK